MKGLGEKLFIRLGNLHACNFYVQAKTFFLYFNLQHNLFNIQYFLFKYFCIEPKVASNFSRNFDTKTYNRVVLLERLKVEHQIFYLFLVKFLHRIVLFFKNPYFKFKFFLCAEQENLSVSNLFSNKMMGLIPVLSVGPILNKNRKFQGKTVFCLQKKIWN